jgi:hypothetical protein
MEEILDRGDDRRPPPDPLPATAAAFRCANLPSRPPRLLGHQLNKYIIFEGMFGATLKIHFHDGSFDISWRPFFG